MAKRKSNPLFSFKKYYVTCDGKKFGPFNTRAKATSMAEKIARVLDKPAKIFGQAKKAANPKKAPRTTRRRNSLFGVVKRRIKRVASRGKYLVLDKFDGTPVHTGILSKTEALKIAKEARQEGEKVRLYKRP